MTDLQLERLTVEYETGRIIASLAGKNRRAQTALIRTVQDHEHGVAFLDEARDSKLTGEQFAALWHAAGQEPRPFATMVWHEAVKQRHGARRAREAA